MDDLTQKSSAIAPMSQPLKPWNHIIDWRIDTSEQTFHCEAECCVWFGFDSSPVPLSRLIQSVAAEQKKPVIETFKQVLASGKEQFLRCPILLPNHAFSLVELFVEKISAHELQGTLTPLFTVTSQEEVAQVLYSVFENAHHGIVVTDEETRIIACNRYFERVTGYLRSELAGLKTNIFNADKHSDSYYQALWQNLAEHGYWTGTILTRTASGENLPQELTIQRVSVGNGRKFYLGLSTDLSAHFERINDNEHGGVDLLTQLPAKDRFLSLLEGLCRKRSKVSDTGCILLAIQPNFAEQDLPDIKREFANYLQQHTNAVLSGYIGHNKFAVCLEFHHPQRIQKIRAIRKSIKLFFHSFKKAAELHLAQTLTSGRTGVSVLGLDAKTSRNLFSHANQALLEMHSGQQNHISFYDHQMHVQIDKKKRLEELLIRCVKEGKLEVHYQPIVNIHQWRVEKFEALCRFPPSLSAEASVQELITIAEDLEMIETLDQQVARKALHDLPKLQALFGEQVGISFNRSVHSSVSVDTILDQSALLIDESGVAPHSVTLEITESAYFESEERHHHALNILRDAGVTLAVDDFGTGYSSLSYLKACHFDILKIDRIFVSDIKCCSNQYRIVRSLTELSHQLGLKVIAEGVETEEELEIISSIGVDSVQGFLFSKPCSLQSLQDGAFDLQLLHHYRNKFGVKGVIAELATPATPHLDPGEPISLAYEYLAKEELNILPVVDEKECVGFVDREAMNLHLTPHMGTDTESMKEASLWNKRVNQVMVTAFEEVHWQTQLSALPSVINQTEAFPWILVDDQGHYKGLVEMHTILKYLTQQDVYQ